MSCNPLHPSLVRMFGVNYSIEAKRVVVGKDALQALKTLQLPQRFFSLTAAAGSLVEPPKAEAQFKKYWVCLDS